MYLKFRILHNLFLEINVALNEWNMILIYYIITYQGLKNCNIFKSSFKHYK
jgi:hypothetical protein